MRYLLPLAMFVCLNARLAGKPAGWGPVEYLLGDWTGEGGGAPGQGSGSFSFKPDLQGKILARKNHAEYPAAKDHAAFVHDDLMVVYRDTPEAAPHAIYLATYIEASAHRAGHGGDRSQNRHHLLHDGEEASGIRRNPVGATRHRTRETG